MYQLTLEIELLSGPNAHNSDIQPFLCWRDEVLRLFNDHFNVRGLE